MPTFFKEDWILLVLLPQELKERYFGDVYQSVGIDFVGVETLEIFQLSETIFLREQLEWNWLYFLDVVLGQQAIGVSFSALYVDDLIVQ